MDYKQNPSMNFPLQESELSKDHTAQEPFCLLRSELNHHSCVADKGGQETRAHVQWLSKWVALCPERGHGVFVMFLLSRW